METAPPSAPSTQVRTNNAPGFDISIVEQTNWKFTALMPQIEDTDKTTEQHTLLANTTMPTHEQWEPRWLVDETGEPITAKYIPKRQHAHGISAKRATEIDHLQIIDRKFQEPGWSIQSDRQEQPLAPDEHTIQQAERISQRWINEDATRDLLAFLRKSKQDENGSGKHRARLKLGAPGSELRIGTEQYHPSARALIANGWTLIRIQGRTVVLDQTSTDDVTWGFSATELRRGAERIGWPDKNLLTALRLGFEDHSEKTPPISIASPHQYKALENKAEFDKLIDKEIQKGWYTAPTPQPATLPFRLIPGSLEPKSTLGKFRLIRNSSWPRLGSHKSCITNGTTTRPLATNACTILPDYMQFEWTSIDTNNTTILILADLAKRLGTNVRATTIDFADWFRQLAVAKKDFWKSAIATRDGIRIDKRLQMGRRSSALHGKRVSYLIAELVEKEAESRGWGLQGLTAEQIAKVREWQTSRSHLGPRQQRIVKLGPFQDDHVIITITPGQAVLRNIRAMLQDRLKVELSPKPEANAPLSANFTAIGAAYDTSASTNITIRPRDSIVDKFRTVTEEANRLRGKLIPLRTAQSWMGLAQFIQQFIDDGRFYLKSGFSP